MKRIALLSAFALALFIGVSVLPKEPTEVSFDSVLILLLGVIMTTWFSVINQQIQERADRIEKRLDAIEGKEKEM